MLQAAPKRGVNRGPCTSNRAAEISKSALAAQRRAGGGGWDVHEKIDIRTPPRKQREGVRAIWPTTNARPHRAEGTGGRPVAGEMPRGAQAVHSALEHKPTRQKSGRRMPNPRERHGRKGRAGGHRDAGVVSSEKTIIADEGVDQLDKSGPHHRRQVVQRKRQRLTCERNAQCRTSWRMENSNTRTCTSNTGGRRR